MALSTAVDLSAVARVVGIKTEFVNLRGGNVVNLPQRIAVFGQGSTHAPQSMHVSGSIFIAIGQSPGVFPKRIRV